jgi:hypothetical protein
MLTIHFYPLLANKALNIPFATSYQYIQREAWVLQKKKREKKEEKEREKENKRKRTNVPLKNSLSH